MTPPAADPLDLGPPGQVLGLRAFRCGAWNDVPTDEGDVRDLANNFARFARPVDTGDPFLVPCVSLFHENRLSFGRVTAARAAGEFLDLDLDGVPLAIRRWMRADMLASPSVEFWDPYRFVGPDGTKWPTRVLKLVTLLGNEPPAAKGLPPLSAATYPGLDDAPVAAALPRVTGAALAKYRDAGVSKFRDQAPATRSGGRRMNPERQKWIDALAAAGFPAELFTDAIPDPFLQAMLGFVQKAAQPQNPNADTDPDEKKPVAMADDDGDEKTGKGDGVQKFRDASGREQAVRVPKALLPMARAVAAQLDVLHAANAATAAAQARQSLDGRKAKVRAFRDEMTRPDPQTKSARMTPAQFDALEPMLLASDDSGVRNFADGKAEGTELEERFAALRTTFSAGVRKFGDTMDQKKLGAGPDAVPPVRNPAVPPKAGEISPETRAILESAGFAAQLARLPA